IEPRHHWSKHTLNQSRLETRGVVPGEQSGLEIGIGRRARRAYGFDEVALVPGGVTLNPEEVDISFSMGDRFKLPLPIWGSAMDGVVDVEFAIAMGKLGESRSSISMAFTRDTRIRLRSSNALPRPTSRKSTPCSK